MEMITVTELRSLPPLSVPCKINNHTGHIAPSCLICFIASGQLLCFAELQEGKKPSQVSEIKKEEDFVFNIRGFSNTFFLKAVQLIILSNHSL